MSVPASDGKDTNLDLRSVTVRSERYVLTTQNSANSSSLGGLGANKRTVKYIGEEAAVGAVWGAILGGGKGAAIGGLVGGAGRAGRASLHGSKESDTS